MRIENWPRSSPGLRGRRALIRPAVIAVIPHAEIVNREAILALSDCEVGVICDVPGDYCKSMISVNKATARFCDLRCLDLRGLMLMMFEKDVLGGDEPRLVRICPPSAQTQDWRYPAISATTYACERRRDEREMR